MAGRQDLILTPPREGNPPYRHTAIDMDRYFYTHRQEVHRADGK